MATTVISNASNSRIFNSFETTINDYFIWATEGNNLHDFNNTLPAKRIKEYLYDTAMALEFDGYDFPNEEIGMQYLNWLKDHADDKIIIDEFVIYPNEEATYGFKTKIGEIDVEKIYEQPDGDWTTIGNDELLMVDAK